jgi:hypothetical protein
MNLLKYIISLIFKDMEEYYIIKKISLSLDQITKNFVEYHRKCKENRMLMYQINKRLINWQINIFKKNSIYV